MLSCLWDGAYKSERVVHVVAAGFLSHISYFSSSTTVVQSMKLGIDVNRHKEIVVKAISGLLLILLKHFKLNHVYQVIPDTGNIHFFLCFVFNVHIQSKLQGDNHNKK